MEDRCFGISPLVTSGFFPTKDPQAKQSVVDGLGEWSWFMLDSVGTVPMLWVSVSSDLSMASGLKGTIPVFLNASLTLAGEQISSMVWDSTDGNLALFTVCSCTLVV